MVWKKYFKFMYDRVTAIFPPLPKLKQDFQFHEVV